MSNVRDNVRCAVEHSAPSRFPARYYLDAASYFAAYADETVRAASSIDTSALDRAAAVLLDAYTRGRTVFSCGNGGSAAIANHLQCDHLKSIRTGTDITPRVVSLSTNVELLTAIANHLTYDEVFAYQLQSQSVPGDVLVAISSRGCSVNIVRAVTSARDQGMGTIALTGFDGGAVRRLADVSIHVNAVNYGIVEDLHLAVMHALAQCIRQSRMTTGTLLNSAF